MFRFKIYFEDGTHLESSPVTQSRMNELLDCVMDKMETEVTGCSTEQYIPDIGWVVYEEH